MKNCKLWWTDNVQGQVSKHSRFENEEYHWVFLTFPSFSWGIFSHLTCLEQLHASKNIWCIINMYIHICLACCSSNPQLTFSFALNVSHCPSCLKNEMYILFYVTVSLDCCSPLKNKVCMYVCFDCCGSNTPLIFSSTFTTLRSYYCHLRSKCRLLEKKALFNILEIYCMDPGRLN